MTKLPTQSFCCPDLLLTVTVPNKHLSHLHSEVVWIRGYTQFSKRKLSNCLLFLPLLQLGPSSLHTPTVISWRQMSSQQRGRVWTGQTGWRSARPGGAVSSAASDYMSCSFISLHGLDRIYWPWISLVKYMTPWFHNVCQCVAFGEFCEPSCNLARPWHTGC